MGLQCADTVGQIAVVWPFCEASIRAGSWYDAADAFPRRLCS